MYDDDFIGQDAAKALDSAIINNKMLKRLSLCGDIATYPVDKESAMIIRSLYNNNTITELRLNIILCKDGVTMVTREVEMVNSIRKSHNEHIIDFILSFTDPQGGYAAYTEGELSWWYSHSTVVAMLSHLITHLAILILPVTYQHVLLCLGRPVDYIIQEIMCEQDNTVLQ